MTIAEHVMFAVLTLACVGVFVHIRGHIRQRLKGE